MEEKINKEEIGHNQDRKAGGGRKGKDDQQTKKRKGWTYRGCILTTSGRTRGER